MATPTAFPVKAASTKQLDFIAKLRGERTLKGYSETSYQREAAAGLTSRQASYWIERLLDTPLNTPKAPGPVGNAAVIAALEGVELSKYAVPSHAIMIPGVEVKGDLLFLEVRRFKETTYMRRLHGAPGDFTRTRFTPAQTIALAAVIKGKHEELARLFGEHFTCCGRCGAPLTDQKSRETFLGPECRKVFALRAAV